MVEKLVKFKKALDTRNGTNHQVMANVERHLDNVEISVQDPSNAHGRLFVCVPVEDYKRGIEDITSLYNLTRDYAIGNISDDEYMDLLK